MYVGKKLKQLRLSLELNQTEMSNALSLSQSYYSAVEAGKRKITQKMITNIIEKWNIDSNYFISNKQDLVSDKLGGTNIANAGGMLGGVSMDTNIKASLVIPDNNKVIPTNTKQKGKEAFFNKLSELYLINNPDIRELKLAVSELSGFEYILSETLKKYYYDFTPEITSSDSETIQEHVYNNLKQLERLRPIEKPLLKLADAIKNFYKEMLEAGDEELFYFAKEGW